MLHCIIAVHILCTFITDAVPFLYEMHSHFFKNVMSKFYVFILHMKVPGADSGVVRIDPLRFLLDVVKGD